MFDVNKLVIARVNFSSRKSVENHQIMEYPSFASLTSFFSEIFAIEIEIEKDFIHVNNDVVTFVIHVYI
jgi:hypothetical protein